jgi:hypothetical protein
VELPEDPSGNSLWTFIKPDGSLAMERRFSSALSFRNGLARVTATGSDGERRDEYVNPQGETILVIPEVADSNMTEAKLNLDGNTVRGQVHRYGETFELSLCLSYDKCGVQDMQGNWIIEPNIPGLIGDFNDGLAVFSKGYHVVEHHRAGRGVSWQHVGSGVVNRKGEIIVDMGKYDSISLYDHGLAEVSADGHKGVTVYLDVDGNIAKNPLLPIGEPSEGLQLVLDENEQYGFVRAR